MQLCFDDTHNYSSFMLDNALCAWVMPFGLCFFGARWAIVEILPMRMRLYRRRGYMGRNLAWRGCGYRCARGLQFNMLKTNCQEGVGKI